jgi:hypothetical protein
MSPFTHTLQQERTRVSRRLPGAIREHALLDPRRPFRTIEREARHLHEVEQVGESEWTPWIAILGLVLFFVPVFVFMTALTFAAASFGQ